MEDVERTRVRREISSSFRINAFEPKKEVLDTCVEALCKFDKEKRKKWLNKIIETLRKQSLSSSVVTQDVIREVFAQISNRATKQNDTLFNVFDAFSIRRYVFDADCRKMLPVEEAPKVVSTVDKATEAIRHRFQLVAQRISRCRQLQAIKFSTVESLLGSSRRQNDVVVVGMLTQQKSHCYHIEDLTGSMQVEFNDETKFQHSIFTEGSVAIFQGSYDASLLTVREVASVPLESAEETRAVFGNVNWFGGEDPGSLEEDRLANQLNDFASSFTSTHFVFVPGPDDPCLNMVLPRPHLPGVLFKYFEQIPNCLFATNPVRIQYASQEIVVIRNDLVEKMCRHAVNAVAAENISKSFAKTILSQAHLSPLPPHVAPVLWEFDHVMTMHPLPDVLIVADKFKSFAEIQADTVVCNPGSFSSGSFGFHVYLPFERKIEDSAIDLPADR
ncbi:nucleic acid-binding domain protein [Ancylostoma caninum]|uniref:DNA polymerase II subunit 2 n=1 Tax=Ancylostoma caninum TaxID=29170 RepID=A0A368F9Q4_ANCCA|nr:nucleic acid-binding domain protein [Ancylostoma caninum]